MARSTALLLSLIGLVAAGCYETNPFGRSRSQAEASRVTETPTGETPSRPASSIGKEARVDTNEQMPNAARAFEELLQASAEGNPDAVSAAWMAAEREFQRFEGAALSVLAPAVQSDDPLRREMGVQFLALAGPLTGRPLGPGVESIAKELLELLADESEEVRVNAAAVLLSLDQPPPEAFKTLAELLVDQPNDNVKISAMVALINTASPASASAIPALEKCLSSPNPQVRRFAVVAVGRFGPTAQQSLPTLRLLAGDEDLEVRNAVEFAVQQIESSRASLPAAP